ncbi:MAG: hypothetical protein OEZ06_29190 [Myxococcales bacterium]|nr:hypothetical protein [Myxococcales bacterium]
MKFVTRKPPRADLGIVPPLEDYAFFLGAEQIPFEPEADDFSLANAAWLADLSMLAYRDRSQVESTLSRLGLETISFSQGGSQCFVCHDAKKVLVAFRGTQIVGCDTLDDILTDLDFDLVPFDGRGRVHHGFERDFVKLWPELHDRLVSLRAGSPERPLWVTGHSLGAGLAVLLASRHGSTRGVYTYGCPRVGDRRFAQSYRERTFRLVHNNDYVTELPPALPSYIPIVGGRHHVGELKYIDSEGRLHDRAPNRAQRLADGALGALRYQLGNLERFAWLLGHSSRPDRFFRIPLDSLRDHAPIYYATLLWNQLTTAPFDRDGAAARAHRRGDGLGAAPRPA